MNPEVIAQAAALVVITFGLIQGLSQVGFLLVAWADLSVRPRTASESRIWRRRSAVAPRITLLAPAFNEEASIVDSVRSLLALHYPDFDVVVINDGSRDGTLRRLIEAFDLEPVSRRMSTDARHAPVRGIYAAAHQPRLIVIDKHNGGKADALNAGLNAARGELVCSMDADSLLEPDALLRAVGPFIEDSEHVIAVGGTVRVVNGCTVEHGRVTVTRLPRHPLALMQAVEYLRAFLMARLAFSRLNMLMIISGAFGLFKRSAVLSVGGYAHGTVGEDMELVIRLHRRFVGSGRKIVFTPDAVCWTEAPEDLRTLGRQRARWHRGALEVFSRHREMTLNPRYGAVGLFGFSHILIVDVLGPLVELAGYVLLPVFWMLGWIAADWVLAFCLLTFAFGTLVSVGSIALEERRLRRFPSSLDLVKAAAAAVAENFGYRQLVLFWKLRGTIQMLRKDQAWGQQSRKGFAAPGPAESAVAGTERLRT